MKSSSCFPDARLPALVLCAVLAAAPLATPAGAQAPASQVPEVEPLFEHRSARAALASPGRRAVLEQRLVGIRLDRLFTNGMAAPLLHLNLGDHRWMAHLEHAEPDIAGFRTWSGLVDGDPTSHVAFTERHGVVSAILATSEATYQLRTAKPGTYVLERVDVSRLGDERAPQVVAPAPIPRSPRARGAVADDGGTIDVLMLYTPAARAQAGGLPQVEALVAQIVSDTNTILARSQVAARIRLAAVAELPLVEQPQMVRDLASLRASPLARALRDAWRADLVQLLVSSPDMSSCGVGYQWSSMADTAFDAYSIADVACVAQFTPTHEMGHNLGSHHAPEDGSFGALFPYSQAYKDPAARFRTVMAYRCPAGPCPRLPMFSSATLTADGMPAGTPDQDNARSIREAAPAAANFRRRDLPPVVAAPARPRSLVSGTSVTVAWEPVAADRPVTYLLQVGRAPGRSDVLSTMVSAPTVSGVAPPGLYYWRVFAVTREGASGASAEGHFAVGSTCIVPGAPRALTAHVEGRNVVLTWTAPLDGVPPLVFVLEAGTASGRSDVFQGVLGAGTSVSATVPAGQYFVRLRAQNACGLGPASEELPLIVH